MRILVDATVFSRLNTGIARYERELFNALLKIDKSNQYTFFDFRALKNKLTRPSNPFAGNSFKTVSVVPREIYYRALQKRLAPPIDALLGMKADIALFPNYFLFPLVSTKKSVVFIYDLSFLHFPEYAHKKAQKLLSAQVPIAALKATHIITISNYIKSEIVEQFKVPAQKVSVIYPAVDKAIFYRRPASQVAATRNKFGLNKPYILFIGTLEPRKNIEGLLKAYALLPAPLKNKYLLAIAGGKGWQDEKLNRSLSHFPKSSLKLIDKPTDEDLASLYSGAATFVFPSHYEGFGMPPLEAMACGAPVIASNNSSLPEVTGSAALLINSSNPEEITKALAKILIDANRQKELIRLGYQQVDKFSWQAGAETLYDIIIKIYQNK